MERVGKFSCKIAYYTSSVNQLFFRGASQNGGTNFYSSGYNGVIACPCSSWPLTTGHYPLHCRNPVPPSPARVSETCYTARSSPNTFGLHPNALHAHNCPPTMPRPQTMSTCSDLNVRNLPPAHIAPGAAATTRKCTTHPSAAPPTRSRTRRAIPPMPALPPPVSASCHEKDATVAVLRTFCTKTTSFAHFLFKNDREPTAAVSCYESPCPYPVTRRPKNFSKLDQTGQNKQFDTLSIPCRYPISQKFAATLRHNTTLLGQLWTDSAAYLTACAASPTRRLTPPPTSTLTPARADAMARNEVLYSPKRPGASIPAVVKSAARTRVQQRMKQEGICRSCDGAHAVLARRARRPSQRPRENPF